MENYCIEFYEFIRHFESGMSFCGLLVQWDKTNLQWIAAVAVCAVTNLFMGITLMQIELRITHSHGETMKERRMNPDHFVEMMRTMLGISRRCRRLR